MSKSPKQAQPKSRLWSWLTSIRLTVFLLLILAAVAVIGTCCPRTNPRRTISSASARPGAPCFNGAAWPASIYSPWFLAPITLLALNIMACIVNGLPQAVRRSCKPFTREMALALPERAKFNWPKGVDPRGRVAEVLRRELGRTQHQVIDDKEVYSHEQGRLRPWDRTWCTWRCCSSWPAAWSANFGGSKAVCPCPKGKPPSSTGWGNTAVPLDFQVHLDRFQVLYYPGGTMPKEFRSDLTFLKDGKEVLKAICRVNEPVTFGGLTFYQSSTVPNRPGRCVCR